MKSTDCNFGDNVAFVLLLISIAIIWCLAQIIPKRILERWA